MKGFRLSTLSAFYIMASTAHAGIPVWSFTPNGSPVVNVTNTGTATVSYTISNNSAKPHQLLLSSNTPAGISQSGGPCVLAGKSAANPTPTCTLTLNINGSQLPSDNVSGGPILCQINNGTASSSQCYQPSPADMLVITRTTSPGATTLSASVSTLALSVNDTGTNAALTGNPRQITITNTGAIAATGLNISYPTWPAGTTATSTCGASLGAGSSCTITITPGSNATSSCDTGIAPTPGTMTVSATNVATAVTSNVLVLSYGCQYQGGFLYAVDDTTPNIGSIGGKVASLVDQAAPYINSGPQASSIVWSSNGVGGATANVSYDIIPLISEISSSPTYSSAQTTFNTTYSNESTYPFPASGSFANCSGATDGKCNSSNILVLYNTYNTNYGVGSSPYTLSPGPTNSSYYAAGLCTATINGYSDWYLPAICEIDAVNTNVTCPLGTQSMLASLPFLIGDPSAATPSTSCSKGSNCLAGYYWSSTELSVFQPGYAWVEYFASSGSIQGSVIKEYQFGARCSRVFIP